MLWFTKFHDRLIKTNALISMRSENPDFFGDSIFMIHTLGKSELGFSIEAINFENGPKKILLMSGLHGDEVEGIILTTIIAKLLKSSSNQKLLSQIAFLPKANPDGFLLNKRWNVKNVDLNRNWPTKDWTPKFTNPRYPPGSAAASEAETKVLKSYVESNDFDLVLDFHSYKEAVVLPLLAYPDTALEDSLTKLGNEIGIPVTYEQNDLGYSIAGGFHTWCFEQRIHNVTLEVQKGLGQFEIENHYAQPVFNFLNRLTSS